MKKDDQKLVKDVLFDPRKTENLIRAVFAGQTIACPTCGKTLTAKLPGSGAAPGIYCGNGCTEILLDIRAAK